MNRKLIFILGMFVCVSFISATSVSRDPKSYRLVFIGSNPPAAVCTFTAPYCESLNPLNNCVSYFGIINLRDFLANKANPAAGTLNDRFKSVHITSSDPAIFTFFGNADGDRSAGSCIVTVKKAVTGYHLTSFEHTYEDEFIKVQWWSEQTKLNGRVSSFTVY